MRGKEGYDRSHCSTGWIDEGEEEGWEIRFIRGDTHSDPLDDGKAKSYDEK